MGAYDIAGVYRSKTDEEILLLATNSSQLTPEAQSALVGEMTRRRLSQPVPPPPLLKQTRKWPDSSASHGRRTDIRKTAEFLQEVWRIYHEHFWLFIKLMIPAVLLSFFAVAMARSAGREIAKNLPSGFTLLSHRGEILEIFLVNLAGYFTSWIAFSFSFAAICPAVTQIAQGSTVSIAKSISAVQNRLGPFLWLSSLLFILGLAALGAAGLVDGSIFWFMRRIHYRHGALSVWITTFAAAGLAYLILSRLALSVPAVIVDGYSVSRAIFRSDELTEGKWLALAALLSKSVIGGYFAVMLPYWIRIWIWQRVQLPRSVATTGAVTATTIAEPTMFIGFALLYWQTTRNPESEVDAQFPGQTEDVSRV